MGLFKKIFSSSKPKPQIEVRVSVGGSRQGSPTEFSDDDPSLLKEINSDGTPTPISHTLTYDSACPYCGAVLDKPTKRKRDCPECKKPIYVRTTQELYDHSSLTEEQLMHSDFFESLRYTIFVTKKDYDEAEDKLKKKWNRQKINTYDVLWSLYNNLELYKRHIGKEYDNQGRISEVLRRKQWMDVNAAKYQARRGNDPRPYLELSDRNAISLAKLDKYADGLTVKSFNCCEACDKFDDKTFSIEFLEKNPVLPIKTCTRPCEENPKFTFCTCTYNTHYNWSDSTG